MWTDEIRQFDHGHTLPQPPPLLPVHGLQHQSLVEIGFGLLRRKVLKDLIVFLLFFIWPRKGRGRSWKQI